MTEDEWAALARTLGAGSIWRAIEGKPAPEAPRAAPAVMAPVEIAAPRRAEPKAEMDYWERLAALNGD